jgi:septal ring-binding cell division protein DamX
LRKGRLPEAAQAFATNLRQSASGGFSIQLLVACSADTVEKALANVSDPDLYILPVNYKGRPCYRVCWGLYESEPRADSAVRAVPDYFRKSGSAPRVVPTAGLLP